MELGLYQKQTTKLVMTTELRQAITILQFSTFELIDFLQEEALENPLLELHEKSVHEDAHGHSYSTGQTISQPDKEENDSPVDYYHQHEHNLQAYLRSQLHELSLSEKEEAIVEYLIYNLDEAGYLTLSLQETATLLNVSESDVQQAFKRFTQFEPLGIGARTLQECLLWQLESLEERSSLTEAIVTDDLELLAERKWVELAEKYAVSLAEIQASADLIQQLNPKPGSAYSDETTKYLFPDVTVEKSDGTYQVIVNDYMLPAVRMNRQYEYLLSQTDQDEAQHYMQEKYNKVLWIIRSIEQRRMTLQRLTEAIVKKQMAFIEKGLRHLKPLTLKEIADDIDMHESTVSRAVRQKVIQTPKGLFNYKDLFTSRIESQDGEGTSSTVVKHSLEKIIETEDKRKPLSDQKISELLKAQKGITISRRTIAKYRDELRIPSSSNRKRFQ